MSVEPRQYRIRELRIHFLPLHGETLAMANSMLFGGFHDIAALLFGSFVQKAGLFVVETLKF